MEQQTSSWVSRIFRMCPSPLAAKWNAHRPQHLCFHHEHFIFPTGYSQGTTARLRASICTDIRRSVMRSRFQRGESGQSCPSPIQSEVGGPDEATEEIIAEEIRERGRAHEREAFERTRNLIRAGRLDCFLQPGRDEGARRSQK